MRSLRTRLVFSHVITLFVIFPLLAIALLFLIETQVLVSEVSNQITNIALSLANAVRLQPGIWQNEAEADAFVAQVAINTGLSFVLLNPEGDLIGSNNESINDNFTLSDEANQAIAEGRIYTETRYNLTQIGYISTSIPIENEEQELIGILHVNDQLNTLNNQLQVLRWWIIGTLIVAFIVALLSAIFLALRFNQQLQNVTDAIQQIATGESGNRDANGSNIREFETILQSVSSLQTRLKQIEDTRKQLLANLIHELGRPLGAIQAAIRALKAGAADEPALRDELLTGMDLQIENLKPLLDNLSGLHQEILGSFELKLEPTEPSTWLPKILKVWQPAAQQKGLEWEVNIPDDLPVLSIDRDRINQVIGNLISNAIKYTPETGKIIVGAGQQDGMLWIQIQDDGIGISENELSQIYRPFYRGQETRRFPQGLGLGLSISKQLVEEHNGRIEVESRSNEGSCFTVFLPISQ